MKRASKDTKTVASASVLSAFTKVESVNYKTSVAFAAQRETMTLHTLIFLLAALAALVGLIS
jgi:hypothetical protein